jgi:(1->4)-alpha-D-glucan 1-alpha-D-glucosylmutase
MTQLVLKMTMPGIPDLYQGTEFWDLSFVDPDNRRPIDFDLRAHSLEELEKIQTGGHWLTTGRRSNQARAYPRAIGAAQAVARGVS